jgi:hypothetical protein
MGQGSGRAGHHQRPPSHLLLTIVFNDTHSSSHPYSTAFLLTHLLQLNFWSFAMLFCLWAVALNYWIRFRYLNTYTQLKEPPLLKHDAQELHPDVNTTDAPPTFHNYLDEFLQAVRIFGFLEKPVCIFIRLHPYLFPNPHPHRFSTN